MTLTMTSEVSMEKAVSIYYNINLILFRRSIPKRVKLREYNTLPL